MDMTGLSSEVDTSHIQLEGKGRGQRREKCFFVLQEDGGDDKGQSTT